MRASRRRLTAPVSRRRSFVKAFDPIADSYDRWYDSPEGSAIFRAESACLALICAERRGRWLEVGVGTGRFASALGIETGIDPSPRMLELAARRGVKTCEGRAEALPFEAGSFDGALLALAFCFIADPEQALRECHRVLRPRGRLLLGVIPGDGPWGRAYERKGAEGHPVYAHARFRPGKEIVRLAERAGFELKKAASALFWEPESPPEADPLIRSGIVPEAGFLGLLFAKTD